jgi:carbamoyltransferase
MTILGIKLSHDGGIALIADGTLVFSYEMEKLHNFPRYSAFCITMDEVGDILRGYGYDLATIDRIVIDGWSSWDPDHLRDLNDGQLQKYNFKWKETAVELTPKDIASYGHIVGKDQDVLLPYNFDHAESGFSYSSYLHVSGHVTGAYCTSPFPGRREDSFILVWDGGMPPQLFYYDYRNNSVKNLGAIFLILGYAYITFARHFKPFCMMDLDLSIAGKAMAYMALGKIRSEILREYRAIYSRLKEMTEDIEIDLYIVTIFTDQFNKEAKQFGNTAGFADEDMLTTFQEFIRELLIGQLTKSVAQFPGLTRNLCIAGGCGLNIKWNSSIRDSKLFREVWVPPFPNDAGSAIGTACCEMLVHDGIKELKWNVYSGPAIRSNENKLSLGPPYASNYSLVSCTIEDLAGILYNYNEPVVFLNGAAEIGPRALGHRSILATATEPAMKAKLNDIKNRENYRPVAPICMEEFAPDIFAPGTPDPYMLFEHFVKEAWKEKVPAICHLDGSSRLQTVNAGENPIVYDLLKAYFRLSGIPLLCNTSANLNGRGFFPDIDSAMRWNKANLIWNHSSLYIKKGFAHFESIVQGAKIQSLI